MGAIVWHSAPRAEVLRALQSDPEGLSGLEAARRLERAGSNRVPTAKPPSWGRVFARQLKSPLIYLLAAAAGLSLVVGEAVDAGFIAAVLGLNTLVGGLEEGQAERKSHALQHLLARRASVLRGGEVVEVDAEALVPGDVVWLEPGSGVPADARLLLAHGLELDESLLTGESSPVSKDASFRGPFALEPPERRNMVFAGSLAVRGRGKAVVVETGARTEVGRLAGRMAAQRRTEPPLLVRLRRFTRVLAGIVLFVGTVFVVGAVLMGGLDAIEVARFAVALAVSAVPEGLPVALTVALAVATTRMARRGAILRRLPAVEALGSCTFIATDKTGTLTRNELTARRVLFADGRALEVTGSGYAPEGHVEGPASVAEREQVARIAALSNEAQLYLEEGRWSHRGDPTEVALLVLARKLGLSRASALDRYPPLAEIPFEPERRYAASFHEDEAGGTLIVVKGAPERVLAMCAGAPPGAAGLAARLASEGHRVLALAEGRVPSRLAPERAPEEPSGLVLVGFVGLRDPLREGAKEAIQRCRKAGVEVVMVTGDHPETALAIARELSMATGEDEVLTGAELVQLPEEAKGVRLARARVLARVSPAQKLDVVEAARARGHFVAVTGDGVNDAPALRAAHVGVAMGKAGTDVAREAADVVLSNDDFSTLLAGVEEGRVAYDNVRKVVHLLVSTGAAEVVLVAMSLASGLPLPLTPVQLLWLNLVTNGVQHVALAFEPEEGDVLARPPRRPDERIFDRLMVERTLTGALSMGLVAFGLFSWLLARGEALDPARNLVLLLLVLFENVHVGNSRSETRSLFALSPRRSPLLALAVLVALGLHLVSLYAPPLRALLGTAPVDAAPFAALAALALSVAVTAELHKLSWRLRRRRRAGRAGC